MSKKAPWQSDYGSVNDWMRNTQTHQGSEKTFVERIIAANPDIIDIEMGLPGFATDRTRVDGAVLMVAPRMDIVALEACDDGWRIVFWEAKLAANSEARCVGEALPRVILHQRKNYHQWLNQNGNKDNVVKAYRETCRLMVKLHSLARVTSPLGAGIRAIGQDDATNPKIALSVDDDVRLLIEASEKADTFVKKGHLKKLEDARIHVQMVSPTAPEQHVLETAKCR